MLRKSCKLHYPCNDCGILFERFGRKQKLCIACKEKRKVLGIIKIRRFHQRLKKIKKEKKHKGRRIHEYITRMLLGIDERRLFRK